MRLCCVLCAVRSSHKPIKVREGYYWEVDWCKSPEFMENVGGEGEWVTLLTFNYCQGGLQRGTKSKLLSLFNGPINTDWNDLSLPAEIMKWKRSHIVTYSDYFVDFPLPDFICLNMRIFLIFTPASHLISCFVFFFLWHTNTPSGKIRDVM